MIVTVSLAASLAAGSALAQDADGGAPRPPADPNQIFLAPRTPEGGVYGAATASSAPPAASPAPDASPAPVATLTPVEPGASPPPAALPPPPPPTNTEDVVAPPYGLGAVGGMIAPQSNRALLLRERLRLLDTSLPPLAEGSRRGRITGAVVQMATGTIVGALGFAFPVGSGAQDMRPWLWTLGGVAIATGVLDLAWIPARERLTTQYMQMPFATPRQRRARARFGEYALNEMSADGTRRRVLGAVAGALLPVGLLGVMYRDPIFNGTPYTVGAYDYVLIGFAAVGVVTSVIGLFTRSPEERLRELYWQQIHMREAELAMPQ